MTTEMEKGPTMVDAENDLAALVRAEVARQSNAFQIMQVDSVQEDGSVNLAWGEAIINNVAANQSYNPRNEGDVVLVLNHPAGWRVIDKIGGPVAADTELPDAVDLEFGTPAPGGNFVKAAAVWVQEGRLYVQTGEGPPPQPDDPPAPPKASKPKPVTLSPSKRQGYRSGRKDNQRFAQGASPEYPKAWTSIWLYGDKIKNACAGKTVDTMKIRVARTKAYHGSPRKVRPKLGLHDYTSTAPGSTPSLSRRWSGAGLGLGQSVWMTIPSSQAARLASGADKGLGIGAGTGTSSYLIATGGCGEIKITFKNR